MESNDLALALALQNHFDNEVAIDSVVAPAPSLPTVPGHGGSRSLVDPEWELIDPNPNVHTLFAEFNKTFFWNTLTMVEVRWSPRMTLCAGLCCYEGRGGLCSVRLSQPLLKLRPRKDLVETLLHEMIHAYLFVTDNNKDHDGHGPEFCKHMKRINERAGTNITIYHSFHDEVNEMRKHWWRCVGRCQNLPPYFGYVKRAMNRAPSSNDTWWAQHQQSCGGVYEKIKEPEDYGKKKKKKEEKTSQIPVMSSQNNSAMNAKTDKAQKTLNFNVKKQDSAGNILGGLNSTTTQPPTRGIPPHSRLLTLFGQNKPLDGSIKLNNKQPSKDTSNSRNTSLFSKSSVNRRGLKQRKVGKNLAIVCQQVRRSGHFSVNDGASAFQRCKVVTKFLTSKEQRCRINFTSDDECDGTGYEEKNATCTAYAGRNPTSALMDTPNISRCSATINSNSTLHVKSEENTNAGTKRKSHNLSRNSDTSSNLRSPSKKKPNLQPASPKFVCKRAVDKTDGLLAGTAGCEELPVSQWSHCSSDSDSDMDFSFHIATFCKSNFDGSSNSSGGEDDVLISSVINRNSESANNSSTSSIRLPTFHDAEPSSSDCHILPSTVTCPVCNRSVLAQDINNHVDMCLSMKTIESSNF